MVNSRQKGKRGELAVAEILRAYGFIDARRGQQFKGTKDSPDIICETLPFFVEVKLRQRVNLEKALQKAKEESDGQPPSYSTEEIEKNGKLPWMFTTS